MQLKRRRSPAPGPALAGHSRGVEIARIQIYSTTGDTAAVYARRVGRRIRYRVVDEYAG